MLPATTRARYVEAPRDVAAALAAAPAGTALVIATDRELAALATFASRIPVRALPRAHPSSHYELLYPLTFQPGPAVILTRPGPAPACAGPETTSGSVALAPLPESCLDDLRPLP